MRWTISDNSSKHDVRMDIFSNSQFEDLLALDGDGDQNAGSYGGKFLGSPGSWEYTNGGITFSDRRLKQDIKPILQKILEEFQGSRSSQIGKRSLLQKTSSELHREGTTPTEQVTLDLLRALKPVSYKYKKASESKFSTFGFIAQDLEKVLPSLVVYDEKRDIRAIRTTDMLAVLTMILQSLDNISLDRLQNRVAALDQRVDADYHLLEPKVGVLENQLIEGLLNEIVLPRLVQQQERGNATALAQLGEVVTSQHHHVTTRQDFSENDESQILLAKLKKSLLERKASGVLPEGEGVSPEGAENSSEGQQLVDDLIQNLGDLDDETLIEIGALLEDLELQSSV
jgi:hypothetical protein